jgi:hypothetical protein
MYGFNFKNIENKKIILLGEVHGVRENVKIIKKFIDSIEKKGLSITVAFEWPSKINHDIQKFLNNEDVLLNWKNWEFVHYKDGRISKEHILFLDWIKNKNKILPPERKHDIFCFSEDDKSWDGRDLKMAENIKSLLMSKDNKRIVLAIMGNLHAQKEKVKFDKKYHTPLALNLPLEDLITFKIDYICGTFFNHLLQNFDEKNKCEEKSIYIEPSKTKNFDYRIIVPHAHSITLLKTNIE